MLTSLQGWAFRTPDLKPIEYRHREGYPKGPAAWQMAQKPDLPGITNELAPQMVAGAGILRLENRARAILFIEKVTV